MTKGLQRLKIDKAWRTLYNKDCSVLRLIKRLTFDRILKCGRNEPRKINTDKVFRGSLFQREQFPVVN